DHLQVVELGGPGCLVQGGLAADQGLAAALDPGPDAQQVAGRALGVEVPQQGAASAPGGQVGEVDGGGGLADPALDVVGRQGLHEATIPVVAVVRAPTSRSMSWSVVHRCGETRSDEPLTPANTPASASASATRARAWSGRPMPSMWGTRSLEVRGRPMASTSRWMRPVIPPRVAEIRGTSQSSSWRSAATAIAVVSKWARWPTSKRRAPGWYRSWKSTRAAKSSEPSRLIQFSSRGTPSRWRSATYR